MSDMSDREMIYAAARLTDEIAAVLRERFGHHEAIVVATALSFETSRMLAKAWEGDVEGALDFLRGTLVDAMAGQVRAHMKGLPT